MAFLIFFVLASSGQLSIYRYNINNYYDKIADTKLSDSSLCDIRVQLDEDGITVNFKDHRSFAIASGSFHLTFTENYPAYRDVMNSAKTLEEALKLGFDFLALGSKFTGPQGKITLLRNGFKKDSDSGAEVHVKNAEANDNKLLFTAHWHNDSKEYKLSTFLENIIEDWNDKW